MILITCVINAFATLHEGHGCRNFQFAHICRIYVNILENNSRENFSERSM